MAYKLRGLGASIYESHPEILRTAEAVAAANGLSVSCVEEQVDNIGGRWWVRTCDRPAHPNDNVDADQLATGAASFLATIREYFGLNQTTSPQPLTSFTDNIPPATTTTTTTTTTPAATCDAEIGQARNYLLGVLQSYGLSGDARYTAKLNTEFANGLTWWRSNHANYCGLYAYVQQSADATVRGWITQIGVAPPATTPSTTTPSTTPPGTTPSTTTPGTTTPGTNPPAATPAGGLSQFWKTLFSGSGSSTSSTTPGAAVLPSSFEAIPNWVWLAVAAGGGAILMRTGKR